MFKKREISDKIKLHVNIFVSLHEINNVLRKRSMKETDKVITELHLHKNTLSLDGFTEEF